MGAPAPPRRWKFFSGLIYRKMCKCTLPPEQESIFRNFRTDFAGWLRFGGIFRWSLRVTTKKVVNFFGQKSAPPDKILTTPMKQSQPLSRKTLNESVKSPGRSSIMNSPRALQQWLHEQTLINRRPHTVLDGVSILVSWGVHYYLHFP